MYRHIEGTSVQLLERDAPWDQEVVQLTSEPPEAGPYLSSSTSPQSWIAGRSFSSPPCNSLTGVSESSSVITHPKSDPCQCSVRPRAQGASGRASSGLRPSRALPEWPDACVRGGTPRSSARRRSALPRAYRSADIYASTIILNTIILAATVCAALTMRLATC